MKLIQPPIYTSNKLVHFLDNLHNVTLAAAHTFLAAVFLYGLAIVALIIANPPVSYLPLLTLFIQFALGSFVAFFLGICASSLSFNLSASVYLREIKRRANRV